LGVLGLSNTTTNRRDRTEVVQEEEDLELGKGGGGEPTTTRNSKPTRRLTTSEGSDSSGIRLSSLFTFNKKKKEEENKQQQLRQRQSRRGSDIRGDEYHWNEVNINQSSDSDSSNTRRKKIAAFLSKYCCRIPTLVVLLVLLLGSIATVISIIILRRGGGNNRSGGDKLDGGLNDFPTSSPTDTKLVNACVCYPINNTTAATNSTNSTTTNNTSPSTIINSGVYNIGGINYQCLEDDSTIVPEYLTICIYPTFNIFSDKYNMDGYNYGKTNEQVINVDGDVKISTFGELLIVPNINEEINVVGVTSFGTLNVNNLDMSLLINTDDLLLEEEIMNYYEDAIKMGKFYINILIVYLLFGWFSGNLFRNGGKGD